MLVVGAKEEEDGSVSVRSRFEAMKDRSSLTDFLCSNQDGDPGQNSKGRKKEDDK